MPARARASSSPSRRAGRLPCRAGAAPWRSAARARLRASRLASLAEAVQVLAREALLVVGRRRLLQLLPRSRDRRADRLAGEIDPELLELLVDHELRVLAHPLGLGLCVGDDP